VNATTPIGSSSDSENATTPYGSDRTESFAPADRNATTPYGSDRNATTPYGSDRNATTPYGGRQAPGTDAVAPSGSATAAPSTGAAAQTPAGTTDDIAGSGSVDSENAAELTAPKVDAASGATNTTSIPTRITGAPSEPADAHETDEAPYTQPISASELRRRAEDDDE
jgi:hypothetical protein